MTKRMIHLMLELYPKRPDPALFLLESGSLDGPKALVRDSIILFLIPKPV